MGCTNSHQNDTVEPIILMPGASSHAQLLIHISDTSQNMTESGGASAKQELKQVITNGRKDIKQAQEKLNSSLTTPLAESEMRVIEKGTWINEVKDVTRRFNTLPPIAQGNKVKKNAMSFVIE